MSSISELELFRYAPRGLSSRNMARETLTPWRDWIVGALIALSSRVVIALVQAARNRGFEQDV